MVQFRHSIRKQALDVEVDSEAMAIALQARISEINRRRFLRVIERVFDDLAPRDRQVKIDRLDVDLGTLPYSSFERIAAERLERELRRVLAAALRKAEESPSEDTRSQPVELSRLELLEYYLLHGTVPFWAPSSFSFEDLFGELLEGDPEGLARLVRRHGRHRRVIERLVLQLDESVLFRLVHVLEPADAALIIAYIVDLKDIHRAEPLLALSEKKFSEVVWVLTLSYLLQEPGTQFNRKIFVRSLLEGMAEGRGLEYLEILATLQLGLERTRKKLPIRSSLPAVIQELVREAELARAKKGEEPDLLALARRGARREELLQPAVAEPVVPVPAEPVEEIAEESTVEEAEEAVSEELAEVLAPAARASARPRVREGLRRIAGRSDADRTAVVEWISRAKGPEALLTILAPGRKRSLLELLGLFDGAAAGVSGSAAALRRSREITLAALLEVLLTEAKSGPTLAPTVRRVVAAVARRVGVGAETLAAVLRTAPAWTAGRVEARLARAIEAIPPGAEEAVGLRPPRQADEGDRPASGPPRSGAMDGDRPGARTALPGGPAPPVSGIPSDELERGLEWLEHRLLTGQAERSAAKAALGLAAWGTPDLRELFRLLVAHRPAAVRERLFLISGRSPALRSAALGRLLDLSEPGELLAVLAPDQEASILALVELFSAAAVPASVRSRLGDRAVWEAVLEALLTEGKARPILAATVRRSVETLARRVGMGAEALAAVLRTAPAWTAGRVEARLARAIDRFGSEARDDDRRGAPTAPPQGPESRASGRSSGEPEGGLDWRGLDWLEHCLVTGQTEWSATEAEKRLGAAHRGTRDLRSLLRLLARRPAPLRERLLRISGRSPALRPAVLGRLLVVSEPPDLLALLAPAQETPLLHLVRLSRSIAASPSSVLATTGDRAVWEAVLEALLSGTKRTLRATLVAVAEALASRAETEPLLVIEAWLEEAREGSVTVDGASIRLLETIRQTLSGRRSPRVAARAETPAAEREAPMVFGRYDRFEILRSYLRHGVLPWAALAREPGLTAERVLADLLDLPRSRLEAIFAGAPEARRRTLRRAVRGLSGERREELVLRLLADDRKVRAVDSPFRSAMRTFAAKADDEAEFFVRLLAAVLDQRPLDFEELATGAPGEPATGAPDAGVEVPDVEVPDVEVPDVERPDEPPRPDLAVALGQPADLTSWDVHILKSVLLDLLRGTGEAPLTRVPTADVGKAPPAAAGAGDAGGVPSAGLAPGVLAEAGEARPSPSHLLVALVTAYPEDARQLLRVLRRAPALRSALIRETSAPVFDRLLAVLCPAEAGTVRALMGALDRVPSPYRPGPEDVVRRAVLEAVLLTGEPLTEAFFVRVLRELFSTPLPERVRELLQDEVSSWKQDRRTTEAAAALEAAVLATAGAAAARATAGSAVAPGAPSLGTGAASAPRRAAAERISRSLREAVFAYLLGKSPSAAIADASAGRVGGKAGRADRLSDDGLREVLREMLEAPSEEVRHFVRRHARDRQTRERWIAILPESSLARLSHLLEPRQHRVLLDAAEILADAWREVAPPGQTALVGREGFWSFFLDFLADSPAAGRSVERLVVAFFDHLLAAVGVQRPGRDRMAEGQASVGRRLLEQAGRLARRAGRAGLVAVLHRDRSGLLAPWEPRRPSGDRSAERELPPPRPAPARAPRPAPAPDVGSGRSGDLPGRQEEGPPEDRRPASVPEPAPELRESAGDRSRRPAARDRPEPSREESRARRKETERRRPPTKRQPAFHLGEEIGDRPSEPIYIDNAGLVLAGPFFPHLFRTLDMLEQDDDGRIRLRDPETSSRAVHLLQYLVDGSTSTAEPLLVLNKLLCGVPTGAPVAREIEPADEEIEACDKLLRSMIANWEIIQDTSIAGLREAFLQREGRLERTSEGWKLTVQRKTLDVLVDRIPWSISIILHHWMPEPIHVSW